MQKKIIVWLSILVALLVLLHFLKTPIFRYVLNQNIPSVERRYDLRIEYSGARIAKLSNIVFDSLHIVHPNSKTSVAFKKVNTQLPIHILLKLKSKLKNNTIRREHTCADTTFYSNRILFHLNRLNSMLINLSEPLYSLYTHCSFSCSKLCLQYGKNGKTSVSGSNFECNRGNFSLLFLVSTDSGNQQFFTESKVNRSSHSVTINTTFEDGYTFPLIQSELGTPAGMDSLSINLEDVSPENKGIRLGLKSNLYGLRAQHNRLADSKVFIDSVGLYLSSNHSEQIITIDKPSYASFNQISIPFSLTSTLHSGPEISLAVSDHIFEGNNIFESIPKGLFKRIENIKVDGNVSLTASIDVDFCKTDSLKIFAKLSPQGFTIKQYGNTDFRELNRGFTHRIHVNDTTTKAIVLDTVNPSFCPLNQISHHVINSAIVTEDGGFFRHKGFDAEAFSYAISRNIKDKKLARGGSTITMQLVKNLYLDKKKTIARKAEEAVIVWLIESQHLVSKERMLEIYLNIIDWGPNINGITEAAQFYFQKKPIDIELNEAIFLASVIPRPSHFTNYFDSNLELKKHMPEYFKNVSSTMLLRKMISEEEFAELDTTVQLKGKAREILEFNKTPKQGTF